MAAKALINEPSQVVTEALEGLVAATPHLALLEGFPSVSATPPFQLLSLHTSAHVLMGLPAPHAGGGSGHEPATAGYVGAGMLTAAVCGEVFASPSEDAVLAAIRATTGEAGCLLVVNNYTGDRLNFGAAAERAKAEGLDVQTVVVADDCAIKSKAAVGRRGIAGSVFALKAAGAAAASGASLAEVTAAAEATISRVGSMGASLTGCTLFGQPKSDRWAAREVELGLGVHGEPGTYREKLSTPRQLARLCCTLSPSPICVPHLGAGERVALLVNNLGSTTALEMHVAAHAAAQLVQSQLHVELERLYCGRFMTSLDMHGLSITLLRLDDATLELLDAPTKAPAWPSTPAVYSAAIQLLPVPAGATDEQVAGRSSAEGPSSEQGQLAHRCIAAVCEALVQAEAELNALDAKVGDGDCGSTLAQGAVAIQQQLASLPLDDPSAAALALGRLVGRAMGGTSGAVYKILLTAIGASLRQHHAEQPTLAVVATAVLDGARAVSKYGGAQLGSRTMLDAIIPAAQVQRGGCWTFCFCLESFPCIPQQGTPSNVCRCSRRRQRRIGPRRRPLLRLLPQRPRAQRPPKTWRPPLAAAATCRLSVWRGTWTPVPGQWRCGWVLWQRRSSLIMWPERLF
ncbi:hypothetical protein CHLNCDRAFT_28367 [Chlorella variabilis]|uniref:Uncharacterized protein n=1 Tax=Chlorella variabilis TaxID=554065 RepID=E1ZST4_CHLVA|nr:hypothetical protein CHLNCDRAFT_28367 [Chlorella variabilis]EFN51059.1 hypothetical protein CHLNCDRAFT_28367 [Chlorella variabilis]|eukprot:XP_005843161.1 hypothetical protein CHLNCDRAFT_28367 [Chlorella variabilis]